MIDSPTEVDHSNAFCTLSYTDLMLLHYEVSIHLNVTLTLHVKLSLSRDCYCKAHVNQRLFRIQHGKIHAIFNT